MGTRLVLKRLSATDLTIFEFHHRITKGKQKAINLDKVAFARRMYPAVDAALKADPDTEIGVDIVAYGPSAKGPLEFRQHIKLQDKNIRLGATLVPNPQTDPARFELLKKDDIAVFAFVGDTKPVALRMYLIARDDAGDKPIYDAIMAKYGSQFGTKVSMVAADQDELSATVNAAVLSTDHPILLVVDGDALEDAGRGGEEGLERLRKGRPGRDISLDEMRRAQAEAEKVGREGEELLNRYFGTLLDKENISAFIWVADNHPFSPFDFEIQTTNPSGQRKLDAKSTRGAFERQIHISIGEVRHMAESEDPYDIYRLYGLSVNAGRLRIASDIRLKAQVLMEAIDDLPGQIRIDGFAIEPSFFEFGDEMHIDFIDTDGGVDD